MAHASEEPILTGQLEYYRSRAAEFDQWWRRTGRYDRGEALNAQWRREASQVDSALEAFHPTGRILELAGGTGIWSEKLCRFADSLTVVDGSAEMLAINRVRLGPKRVDYIQADLFRWQPVGRFEMVFFSFWLSHVPPSRFESFWRLVDACLAPEGRVFWVDSRHEPSSTAVDHQLECEQALTQRRRLNDGREFEIYKIFYKQGPLAARLRDLGWDFSIEETPHYFIHGSGRRSPARGGLPSLGPP